MGQTIEAVMVGKTVSGKAKALLTDDNGALILSKVETGEVKVAFDITTETEIKVGPGTLVGLIVLVAGTATGSINDQSGTGGETVSDQMFVIPETVGTVNLPSGGIPFTNGLVIEPGAGQAIVALYI